MIGDLPLSSVYAVSAMELRSVGKLELAEAVTVLAQEAFEWERYDRKQKEFDPAQPLPLEERLQ